MVDKIWDGSTFNSGTVIPQQPLYQLQAGAVLDEIKWVLHSEENLVVDNSLEIHVGMILIPQVGTLLPYTSLQEDNNGLLKKWSVVTINKMKTTCA